MEILKKQDRKIIGYFGVGEDIIENTMENNENKQLVHQTIQSRFFPLRHKWPGLYYNILGTLCEDLVLCNKNL